MLQDAYDLDGPVAIRWPRSAAPSVPPDQVGVGLAARKVSAGERVCLIGVGKMLAAATQAAALLAEAGVDASVWDPRAAKPLDPAMLADAASHQLVVTVEDGLAEGGIGSNIARELATSDATVLALGVPTEYIPHNNNGDAILADLGLDGAGVAATVRAALDR